MSSQSSDSNIKVAKITATQAIIVAIIMTFGGALTGYLFSGKNKTSALPIQHWLQIHKIEGEKDDLVKIVATVNGTSYRYPSRLEWTEIGSQMSPEKFPLPLSSSCYHISFMASITYPGPVPIEKTDSQMVHEVKLSQVPTGDQIYELYLVIDDRICAKPRLRIIYSIK